MLPLKSRAAKQEKRSGFPNPVGSQWEFREHSFSKSINMLNQAEHAPILGNSDSGKPNAPDLIKIIKIFSFGKAHIETLTGLGKMPPPC
jgi:hypothetical protein